MARDQLAGNLCQEAIDTFSIFGSKSLAAASLGIPTSTFKSRLEAAQSRGYKTSRKAIEQKTATEDELKAEITRLQAQLEVGKIHVERPPVIIKPHYSVRTDSGSKEKIRICAIGDAHDSPKIPDKSRFEWIGQHIKATKPDIVVQIGDFATMDSLNTHESNETFAGKLKPTFMQDMVSFIDALDAMDIDGPERHCTLGNHERRAFLFENQHPESYGMMQFEIEQAFQRFGWGYSPYGFIQKYGNVGFVHCAINRLGKSYGGKNAEQTISNDVLHDLVIGHSHTGRKHRAPKIGDNNHVTVLNLGCALPNGYIENYAKHALTGWTFGIYDLTIQHGSIQADSFIPMAELEERYG
jgi:hypothetical protein